MKLEQRILNVFVILIVIASVFLAIVYSFMTAHSQRKESFRMLVQNAEILSSSVDKIVNESNMMINLVLSDPDTLDSIRSLAKNDKNYESYRDKFFSDEYTTIRNMINSYFFYQDFFRIIYFNESGDVILGNNLKYKKIDTDSAWKDVKGVKRLEMGEIGIYEQYDEWDYSQHIKVISVLKKLVGTNMGYFEIQWLESDLDNLLKPSDPDCAVFLYNQDEELIYSNNFEYQKDYISILKNYQTENKGYLKHKSMLIGYQYNPDTRLLLVVVKPLRFVSDILLPVFLMLAVLLAVFVQVLFLVARKSAQNLVKPIYSLQKIIEETELKNASQLYVGIDDRAELWRVKEIREVYESYLNTTRKLECSIQEAQQLSYLQLKAQMDLLQAQVNPHFLYNVLNIISAKGLMADDETICDMCASLGSMLRYSTNTKEKTATIHDEIEYLQEYFLLLKYRYKHRLDHVIDIDPAIENEVIPKLAIQQIVENSVTHGFVGKVDTLKVEIIGEKTENGWRVSIIDNGIGISSDKLIEIKDSLIGLSKRLSKERQHIEMQIGGMGLHNTYARMYLIFGEALVYRLQSYGEGTRVTIGVENKGT